MDKNLMSRGEIVAGPGKMYSVIGVLGTVLYIQEIDAGNKVADYQLSIICLMASWTKEVKMVVWYISSVRTCLKTVKGSFSGFL